MKHLWKLVVPVTMFGVFAAMAPRGIAPPQDPAGQPKEEVTVAARVAEVQYVDRSGQSHTIPGRNVLALRLIDDPAEGMRMEILYENGDYSLVDLQALHLLRQGADVQEVRLVRTTRERLLFPRLP